jgi:hypothetical protein
VPILQSQAARGDSCGGELSMGYKDNAHSAIDAERLESGQDHTARFVIESGCWLVGEQKSRLHA